MNICVQLSHFAVQQTLAQRCKSTTLHLAHTKRHAWPKTKDVCWSTCEEGQKVQDCNRGESCPATKQWQSGFWGDSVAAEGSSNMVITTTGDRRQIAQFHFTSGFTIRGKGKLIYILKTEFKKRPPQILKLILGCRPTKLYGFLKSLKIWSQEITIKWNI